jgi:hypothetical protein
MLSSLDLAPDSGYNERVVKEMRRKLMVHKNHQCTPGGVPKSMTGTMSH